MYSKRNVLVLILAVGALCAGCAAEIQENSEPVSRSEEYKEDNSQKLSDENDTDNSLYVLDVDYVNGRADIIDLKKESVIGSIACEEGEYLVEAFQYDNGFALIKTSGEPEKNVEEYGNMAIITNDIDSEQWKKCELDLYEYSLNKFDSVSLLDYIQQDGVVIQGYPVISDDATKVAWILTDSIYCIDLVENKSIFSKVLFENNIYPEEIRFVGEDKIGFYGNRVNEMNNTYYGYVNLTDDTIAYEEQKDYSGGTIQVNDEYICINDSENPYTQASSGIVLTYNCETNESKVLSVDRLESTLSLISDDGTMLISINWTGENEFRIRNYDTETMSVIYEDTCNMGESVRPCGITKYGEDYFITYYTTKWGAVYATDHT